MNDVATAERTRQHIARELGVDSAFAAEHLAAVSGISERAAIRDANSAKAFLESSLEQNQ